jgi:hypothetical protein
MGVEFVEAGVDGGHAVGVESVLAVVHVQHENIALASQINHRRTIPDGVPPGEGAAQL